MKKDRVIAQMKAVFKDIPYGVDHSLHVLTDAEAIMDGEGIVGIERELIAIVAILHDVGAIEAQRKYGSMDGAYQEIEGPPIARRILEDLHYDKQFIERACFIIGHHHTPSQIDGIDFQIQWESDMLANLEYMDIRTDEQKLQQYIDENFKSATGKSLALSRFLPPTNTAGINAQAVD